MDENTRQARRFLIGDLVLDTGKHEVSRDGHVVDLPGLSYQLIVVLAETAPNVVSHDELVAQVWPGRIVSPETITQRIKLVRQAIGDDAHHPRYIGLVRGEGYRMLAEVEPLPLHDESLIRGLFSELRRRRVMQVALIYAAIAWSITEILSSLLDALPVLPEWSESLVAIIFVVGFPIAMFLAWRFDIGPSGISRTQTASTEDRLTIPAAMLLLIGATAGLFYLIYPRVLEQSDLAGAQEQAAYQGVPSPIAIAVLPFVDMSPNQDQEYFADGIAEELLNELAQLEGLNVAGRTSSFTFKGSNADLQSIGKQLGVTNILEGSVRKDGNGLRVTVQLINSQTGFHLWSKTYDRQIDDIFFIQEDIARSVAGALSVALDVDDRKALPGAGTSNIEAYDAFLEGRAWERIGQIEKAAPHYQRAIDLDPNYAEAWAAFGATNGIMSWDQPPDQARAMQERGRELVLRAIELDPDLALAYAILSAFTWARGDWVGATEAHQKAIAVAPADIGLQVSYANILGRVGRVRAAIELDESGRKIDPLNFFGAMIIAEHYIQAGRYGDARQVLERAETMSPTTRPGVVMRRLFIAMSEDEPARIRESLEELADANPAVATIVRSVLAEFDSPSSEILRVLRRNYEDEFEMTAEGRVITASLAAYFGDPEFALEAMTEELRGNLLRTRRLWYPFMSDMRKLPGFKILVDEIGFVEYWRTYGWADSCRPLSDDDFECY